MDIFLGKVKRKKHNKEKIYLKNNKRQGYFANTQYTVHIAVINSGGHCVSNNSFVCRAMLKAI